MAKQRDADDIAREEGYDALARETEDPRNDIPIDSPAIPNGQIRQKKAGGGNGHKPKDVLKLLSGAEFVRGFVPPTYLVDGILQRGYIYTVTGATGHGKTAWALLLSQLISSSDNTRHVGRHEVEKGAVIYLAGENATDVRMRCIAASTWQADFPANSRISFIDRTFNIAELYDELLTLQMAVMGPIDMVVVDTSSAYFLGNDEINAAEMGRHARMLRALTALPGHPTVLVLSHPIKAVTAQAQLVPRGSGATLAEVDGNLTIWAITDDLFEFHWTGKLRGPSFEPITFRLETVRTPALVDARNRQIATVRAVQIGEREENEKTRIIRTDEDKLLVAMNADSDRSMADIARECGWFDRNGEPLKSKVHRLIETLSIGRRALVEKDRGRWRLTEKGKIVAREAIPKQERAKAAERETNRFYSVGPAPEGSVCLECSGAQDVLRIKDGSLPGSKAETLHADCAESWFLGGDLLVGK